MVQQWGLYAVVVVLGLTQALKILKTEKKSCVVLTDHGRLDLTSVAKTDGTGVA